MRIAIIWQLLAPLISAAVFAYCFPPHNYFPLAFVAFVPLLIAAINAKNSLQARAAGLIFGFLFYSFTLRWLWQIFPWFTILLWIVMALFTALFTFALFLINQRFGLAIALLAAPFCWLGIEYFRSECWFLKFAWITPGFSQATNLPLLQFASLFGVYGISVLIIAVNSCFAYLIDLTEQLFGKARLIVWPEYSLVNYLHRSASRCRLLVYS